MLEKVTCYKYLGLMIDSDLSFMRHINQVTTRISTKIGMIFVSRLVLINICVSLIHSNIIYLLEVYSSVAKTAL